MNQDRAFKDPSRERRLFFFRVSTAALVIVLLSGGLFWRYHHLQVIRYQDFATQSENNRVLVRPLSPTRGLIFDRNGVLLADNRAGYTLSLVVERTRNLDSLLVELDDLLGLQPEEVTRFRNQLPRRRPYEAVPLRINLSEQEQALLAVNEYRLPGVEITAELVRHYPHKELLSHVLGYVGRINEREARVLDRTRYRGTHVTGKTGLEGFYEDRLHGQVGYEYVEANARGRVMRQLDRITPEAGHDLHLHLDIRLQRAAFEALGEERGAIVVMDIRTGGVLAQVSKPGFDPNLFVTGISSDQYSALLNSLDRPLFDRVLQGQYPPGSIVKPAFALAALESKVVDMETTIYDPGYFQLPNRSHRYRDWKAHGRVNLHDAVVESCDTFFYQAAVNMGIESLHRFGIRFGYGQRTGIDLPSERPGIMPSREWKRSARGEPWYPGDTVNASIGQGYMLTTPMQMAVSATRLASRGEIRPPRLVRTIGDPNPEQPWQPGPAAGIIEASDAHWDYVLDSMKDVVHGPKGTARAVGAGMEYRMGGKTGTAQVVGIAQGEEYDADALEKRLHDHALFIAFAPVAEPEVAIGLIVENGGSGSATAAPMARRVLDTYMALSNGEQVADAAN